jgi:hypothetical protein
VSGEQIEPHAPQLDAEAFPVSLTGAQTTAQEFNFQFGKGSCTGGKLSGEAPGATSVQALTPEYSSCKVGTVTASAVINGCQLIAHVKNAGPPYAGSADVSCPAGKAIEFVVSTAGVTKCTISIGSQTGLEGLTLTNVGKGDERSVDLAVNLSGVKYNQKEGSGIGRCTTTGDFTNGTYTGTIRVGGKDEGAEEVGVFVSGEKS